MKERKVDDGKRYVEKINRKYKGVYTVEMAYIMPITIMLVVSLCYLSLYFYNENVLQESLYRLAMGVEELEDNKEQGETEQELKNKLIGDKLIGVREYKVDVSEDRKEIKTTGSFQIYKWKSNYQIRYPKLKPIDFIRTCRKIEKLMEKGEKTDASTDL